MSLLDRLLGRDQPLPPVLLRVRSRAGAPSMVEVEATWSPSKRRETRRLVTAEGLCLLLWREREHTVDLVVRAHGGATSLRMTARENARGSAVDVLCEDDLAAE